MQHSRYDSIRFERLPLFPASLVRVLRHVRDPEITADSLRSLLGIDQDFSEEVVRLAGLPLFGARFEVHGLAQAIAVLGRDRFYDLLFTVSALNLFRDEGTCPLDAAILRAHSLACAVLARDLSRRLQIGEEGLAYRAGLVHDIGILALGAGAKEALGRVLAKAVEHQLPLDTFEETMLGLDHGLSGQWYAEKLDLEPPIIGAIRYHHNPGEAQGDARGLAALVGFSDYLCRASGVGYGFVESLDPANGLERLSAWKVLCDERPALRGLNIRSIAGELMERLPALQEAALELCGEPMLS